MKRVAILQSNYIPWKGYFDLMSRVDEFIIFDTAQFTTNDWRNRNRIKTRDGEVRWLTIPVRHHFGQAVEQVEVADRSWADQHFTILREHYRKAPFWGDYEPALDRLYQGAAAEILLSRINWRFMAWICTALGIETQLTWSHDYELVDGRTERLASLCRQAGATEYLSGPAARDYLDESQFGDITVSWMQYRYPEYPQVAGTFTHQVSVLDLLLCMGPLAPLYIWEDRCPQWRIA